MFKPTCVVLLSFFSLLLIGCNENVRFSGKVTFSDDSPLSMGTVVFENDRFSAKGDLNSEGVYEIGSLRKNDGLPPGDYRVSLLGVTREVPDPSGGDPRYEFLVDRKYLSGRTSGLVVGVTKQNRVFDFQVDRPEGQ